MRRHQERAAHTLAPATPAVPLAVVPAPHEERRARRARIAPPLPRGASAYLAVIVAVAAVDLAAAAPRLHTNGSWGLFALLTVAASAARLSAVQLNPDRSFHTAIVFVVAGALLLSPQQLVVMCVVQQVPEWLEKRHAWYIQTFNIANYVIAATCAAFAAYDVRRLPLSGGGREAAVGIAAATAFVAANRILLVAMLQLARGLSVRATGLVDADDIALELTLALLAVTFAALWGRSTALALLSLAPVVLIHVTQRARHRLELASRTVREQHDNSPDAGQLAFDRPAAALEALAATVEAR